jgi:DNA-binding response OmpR family regulator
MATVGRRPLVLIVDDEPAIRLLCRVNLEPHGYAVREAGSLAEARARLAEPVALVLLDLHLGPERGHALLAELADRGIPVVVVTGSIDHDAGVDGAPAVLHKPFTVEELLAVAALLTRDSE